MAISEGKALIIALNKIDAMPGGAKAAEALRSALATALHAKFTEAGEIPVVAVSAQEGAGAEGLMDDVLNAYVKWNRR